MNLPATLFGVLLLHLGAALAQGVYVSPGENGPVFSDQPQPGAREMILPPLNVVAPPPESKAAVPAVAAGTTDRVMPEAALLAYRSFSIVQPENYGSVAANTALFEVRVAVDPPLQPGHAFSVSINDRPVGVRFTASEFIVPPELWGDVLPPSGQSLQLDASIVDGDGRALYQAAPVRFFMRQAPLLNTPRNRPAQPPPAAPRAPTLERAVGAAIR
jgi:hypothetical protein